MEKNDQIKLRGKVIFEPEDKTKKQISQSEWKKIAMIFFTGDVCEYYSWFLKRRYNIILNKPLRGAHVSFINDSNRDISLNGQRSIEDVEKLWNDLKNKWDKKSIDIELNLNPRTNDKHWWLNVTEDSRTQLQEIRSEIGLNRPYFGLHMSLGYVNERNVEHSIYIHNLLKEGLTN